MQEGTIPAPDAGPCNLVEVPAMVDVARAFNSGSIPGSLVFDDVNGGVLCTPWP